MSDDTDDLESVFLVSLTIEVVNFFTLDRTAFLPVRLAYTVSFSFRSSLAASPQPTELPGRVAGRG